MTWPAGNRLDVHLPPGALVMLIGAPGSGKSTFAAAHFRPTEIVCLDHYRAMVSDDAGNQSATPAAVAIMQTVVRERLARGRLTVIDATNLKAADRGELHAMAIAAGKERVALVFDVPFEECERRNSARDRVVPRDAMERLHVNFVDTLPHLAGEGFSSIQTVDPGEGAHVVRTSALLARVRPEVPTSGVPAASQGTPPMRLA